jgi:hypothetical protein
MQFCMSRSLIGLVRNLHTQGVDIRDEWGGDSSSVFLF